MSTEYWAEKLEYCDVPCHIREGFMMWMEQRIPPGGFLQAVLVNNLSESMGRADDINRGRLWNICNFLYNYAPYDCWGSRQKVFDWCAEGARSRLEFKP